MQITIEGTKEEIEQLAVIGYIAQFVADSSMQTQSGRYLYPDKDILSSSIRKLNKAICLAIPESELVNIDEKSRRVFTHTLKTENICGSLLIEFAQDMFYEKIWGQLKYLGRGNRFTNFVEWKINLTHFTYHQV
jgi:hypothetical protein